MTSLEWGDRLVWLTTGLIVGIFLGAIVMAQPEAQVNSIQQTQQCQYPQRPLNPDGSCDNSDPCDPANIKNGGACKDPSQDNCSQTNPQSRCYDKPLIEPIPEPEPVYQEGYVGK